VNKLLLLWSVIVVVVAGFVATASRTSADVIRFAVEVGGPPAPVYNYMYYPDAEMYFDPGAHLYWWNRNGVWVSGAAAPAGITLGTGVTLDVDERAPWAHHHDVIVHRYPHHHDHH
jgi:hypothetical protein